MECTSWKEGAGRDSKERRADCGFGASEKEGEGNSVVVGGSRRLYSRPEAQSSKGDRDILLFAGMTLRNLS